MVLSESWGCWRGSGCSNREWVRVPPPPPTPGCSGWLVGLLRWYLSTALRSYPQFDGATQLDSWTSAKDLSSMGLTVLWEGMLKSRSQLTRYCRFYHQDQGQKSWGKKVPKDIHPLWPLLVPFNQHKSECISSLWQPSAFTESPSGARNPPCLLIMAGLLRSDRGSLSVSSPSGERKDACGLHTQEWKCWGICNFNFQFVAYQSPPSMGFSRHECWSGLPFPSPGDLTNPGIEPGSPTLQADTLPTEPPGKPN
ncbi:uncharacterized protein LOC129657824 isoform X5 [Bubalus kerabau]|uniref:uncharacterized protein LOC129657824 isoform X5 n=1 Tax=Bubalus carabanensis TaxID=3119969 RepID=UPI00244E99C8|nr:uncharacterized protein LOC129657824 isoform X5 [Bubalus carabanensis]